MISVIIDISKVKKKGSCPATTTPLYVTLRLAPLDSEAVWTGELWLKTNLFKWQN